MASSGHHEAASVSVDKHDAHTVLPPDALDAFKISDPLSSQGPNGQELTLDITPPDSEGQ